MTRRLYRCKVLKSFQKYDIIKTSDNTVSVVGKEHF